MRQDMTRAAAAARRTRTRGRAAPPALTLRRTFGQPRRAVWNAWTDPARFAEWFGPEGFTVPECALDVRPGGAWRATMHSPKGDEHKVRGVYVEVRPPGRLAFTWIWEQGDMAGVETKVTIDLRARGKGTALTLTHEGLPTASARAAHRSGWASSLVRLKQTFAEQ